jgi:hypothetical protein
MSMFRNESELRTNPRHSRRRARVAIYSALLLGFLLSRVVHLDADIPRYDVTGFSTVDEMWYTQLGFELVEHTPTVGGFDIREELEGRNLVENYATAISLKTFGDNYYGLRVPSVVAGLVTFLLCLLLFSHRFGFEAAALGGAFLICEMGTLVSNRSVEPTVIRLAAAAAVIAYLIWTQMRRGGTSPLLLGLLTGLGWLFVYPTNAFLVLAGAIASVSVIHAGRRIASLSKYALGVVVAGGAYAAVLMLTFSPALVMSGWKYNMALYAGRVAPSYRLAGFNLPFFIYNIYPFLGASYFRLLPGFLGLTLLAFAILAWNSWRMFDGVGRSFRRFWGRVGTTDKILVIYFGCFLLQSLFTNDFPYRKLAFAFPFFLYFVLLGLRVLANALFHRLKAPSRLVPYVIAPLIIQAFVLSWKLVFAHPTYSYRDAMRALAAEDGHYVVGGLSTAFRLYSSFPTYLKPYMYTDMPERKALLENHLRMLAASNKDVYVIDYQTPELERHYAELGFFPVRTVMKANDPTYIPSNVILLKNRPPIAR